MACVSKVPGSMTTHFGLHSLDQLSGIISLACDFSRSLGDLLPNKNVAWQNIVGFLALS